MRSQEEMEKGYIPEEDIVTFIYLLKDLSKLDKDENTIKYMMLARTLQAMTNINMSEHKRKID